MTLIHRDYTDTSNLQIRVYDEKLVMYNGATLSREVPIELFDQPHPVQSRSTRPWRRCSINAGLSRTGDAGR